jgi:hypothetical protein
LFRSPSSSREWSRERSRERSLERCYEYVYERSPERSGRRPGNTSGKYVVVSADRPASVERGRRGSVSYMYDPSQIFDAFLGDKKAGSSVYRPRKEDPFVVIPSGNITVYSCYLG